MSGGVAWLSEHMNQQSVFQLKHQHFLLSWPHNSAVLFLSCSPRLFDGIINTDVFASQECCEN